MASAPFKRPRVAGGSSSSSSAGAGVGAGAGAGARPRAGGPSASSSSAGAGAGAGASSGSGSGAAAEDAAPTLTPREEADARNDYFTVVSYLKRVGEPRTLGDVLQDVQVRVVAHAAAGSDADASSAERVGRAVFELLARSPRVKFDEDNRVRYDHELDSVAHPLQFVESRATGVSREYLLEERAAWAPVVADMLHDASVLAVRQPQHKRVIMYKRHKESDFCVELSCTVTAQEGSPYLAVTYKEGGSGDVRREIRRGDAIRVGSRTYRVSGEMVKDRAVANETERVDAWLRRLPAPYSSSSTRPAPGSPEDYVLEFDAKRIPIHPTCRETVHNATVRKFGCTNDVREKWHEISRVANNNFAFTDTDKRRLDQRLIRAELATEETLRHYNRADIEREEFAARDARERAARAAKPGGGGKGKWIAPPS